MTRFLARRLLNYLVLLALASFLTFALTSYTFTPLNSLLQRNPRPPQAVIDAKAAELDLDRPVPLRYAHWVSGAVRGDFGTTVNGQPVADELWRRIGVSLRLLAIGSLLGTVIGVADTILLGFPCPAEFTAETSKLYGVPLVNPVTIVEVAVEVPSAKTDHELLAMGSYSTT